MKAGPELLPQIDVDCVRRDLVHAIRGHGRPSPRATTTNRLEQVGQRLFESLTTHDRERFALRPPLEAAALTLARAGNFRDAYAAAQALADLDGTESLSPPARLLADSQRDSLMAYVDYRSGDYDRAEVGLCKAIDAIGTLIASYSLPEYAARQVFLGTHWVRVQLRRNQTDTAVAAASGLLSYAEGHRDAWPIARCSPGPCACDPHEEFLTRRVADLVECMAPPLGSMGSTSSAAASIAPHSEGRCAHFARAHAWLRVKALLLKGDVDRFIPEGLLFLAGNRAELPACWDAVASDLWRACSGQTSRMHAAILSALAGALPDLRSSSPMPSARRAASTS